MEYLDAIINSVKMLLDGEFTTGSIMVMAGCLAVFYGFLELLISLSKFPKQRTKLFHELKNRN